jgi:hypothetical protein
MVETLARFYVPPLAYREYLTDRARLVVPLSTHYVQCADGSASTPGVWASGLPAGPDTLPVATRSPRPFYPREVVAMGVCGEVTIKAVVSLAGCISEGVLIQGLYAPLDFIAA